MHIAHSPISVQKIVNSSLNGLNKMFLRSKGTQTDEQCYALLSSLCRCHFISFSFFFTGGFLFRASGKRRITFGDHGSSLNEVFVVVA